MQVIRKFTREIQPDVRSVQQQQQDLQHLYPPPIYMSPQQFPLQPQQQQQLRQPSTDGTPGAGGARSEWQSVSRFSAPRVGASAERRRTSVSRSSMPAVSSTLRRRTPDPQLISSWCALVQSCASIRPAVILPQYPSAYRGVR